MKSYLLTLITFFCLGNLIAQDKYFYEKDYSKVVFETNGHFGKIFRHSGKFEPDVTEFTYNFEQTVSIRNLGKKAWQQKLHYPEVGVTYIHSSFGDKEVFGTANGLFTHVKFWFNRNKIADTYFRVGTGLAYLNKPFHTIKNPTNNVIGSKIDNVTQLRVGADFHLHPRVDLMAAFSFTHYSNAKTQSPNLGINVPALTLGIRYSPFQLNEKFVYRDTISEPTKRNEYNYKFSVGVTNSTIGGAKFPVYIHSLYYARYTSVANKVWVGTSFETNFSEHDKLLFGEETDKLKWKSSNLSLFVADEILLGNVGVNFLFGAYLLDNAYRGAPIYAKLGINYYYYEFGKQDHKLFLGVNLKTHYTTAQFVEVGGGIAF